MKEKFPNKNTEDSLEKELEYCEQLISIIKEKDDICSYPKVQEKLNHLGMYIKHNIYSLRKDDYLNVVL